MKSKSRLIKRGMLCLMTSLLLLESVPTAAIPNGGKPKTVEQVIQDERNKYQKRAIEEVAKAMGVPNRMWNGGYGYSDQGFYFKEFTPRKQNVNIVEASSQMISEDQGYSSVIYHGTAVLRNLTDMDQTMYSQEFSFTVTDTVAYETTDTIGNSSAVKANFNIPFIGGIDGSYSASYSLSLKDGKTHSVQVTHKTPSQPVKVRPGQCIEVRIRLQRIRLDGKVGLIGIAKGTEEGKNNLVYWKWIDGLVPFDVIGNSVGYNYYIPGIYERYYKEPDKMDYKIDINDKAMGIGTYRTDYGSKLYIEYVDLNTGEVVGGSEYDTSTQSISRNANNSMSVNYNALPLIELKDNNVKSKVEIFQHGDFGGASVELNEGRYTASQFNAVGNDELSSIKIPNGYVVTLYEHGDFTGRTLTLTEDTRWVGNFNDITSAIVISKVSQL